VDTRALTKKLRVDGAMKCCLSTLPLTDEEAIRRAREWQDMAGSDYVKDVTCRTPFIWGADDPANHNRPYVPVGTTLGLTRPIEKRFRVAAFDFGAKHSIYRKLILHGFDVQVFPADASAELIREHQPDALFLSNGPGDPAALDYVHGRFPRSCRKCRPSASASVTRCSRTRSAAAPSSSSSATGEGTSR
jgi:carbamoyl-phosphate synthase small subunit